MGKSPPSSFSEEQLKHNLGTLSSIPLTVSDPSTLSAESTSATPSPKLKDALDELSASDPPSMRKLAHLLKDIANPSGNISGIANVSPVDAAAEAEILARAVTIIWSNVTDDLIESALELDDDLTYWEIGLQSRWGAVIYLVQSLPTRVFQAVGSTLTPGSIWNQVKSIHWPKRGNLFRPLHGYGSEKISDQLAAITSPVRLTRNEMIGNARALQFSRDAAARRVGILAAQAPNWAARETNGTLSTQSMEDETTRVYKLLCVVLESGPPDEKTVHEVSVGKRKPKKQVKLAESKTVELPAPEATAQSLLDLMTVGLPQARNTLQDTLKNYGRPSFATRYWPAFLLLPPCLYYAGRLFGQNKEWLKEQIVNAKETVRGFLVQWVWEPIEHITKTMRGGGEGLGVAPETVKTDRESLDRMVMDLGKDYYHMDPEQLQKLKHQVNEGDLESVLKVYESEMRSPIKNAIFGYLIRTLLIQVQKTKTDLSVALLQLDQLLQSQQLTFAFVGIAPSILVLWMVWGWIRNVTSGANRGKGRKRRYFYGMRSIERLLITSTKEDGRMNDRDRGMLIVDVSGLRVWAAGMKRSKREAFLSDLRLFEDQNLDRDDKLRVVDRIWRCWGLDGTHPIQ